MIYLQLFFEFFRAGLFAVGGGLATIPFLQDISARTGWFTAAQLTDMIAVSESTPGPMGVNMATYVGFTSGGVFGAVVATVGLVTPSIIVILIVARFLNRFRDSRAVQGIFYGLRPASTGLMTAVGVTVVATALFTAADGTFAVQWDGVILAAVLLALTNWKRLSSLHPIVWIGLSALAGIVFQM